MASTFYALNRIKSAEVVDENDPSKNREKIFQVGDKVTGLSPEDMKALWKAGALEERKDGTDSKSDEGKKSSGSGSSSGEQPGGPATPAAGASGQ